MQQHECRGVWLPIIDVNFTKLLIVLPRVSKRRLGAERFRRLGTCTAKLKGLRSENLEIPTVNSHCFIFTLHTKHTGIEVCLTRIDTFICQRCNLDNYYYGDLSLFVIVLSPKTKLVTQPFEGIDTIQVVEEEIKVIDGKFVMEVLRTQ